MYGSWEALDGGKSMPQGPLSFSTPGKSISENFISFKFFRVHFRPVVERMKFIRQTLIHEKINIP